MRSGQKQKKHPTEAKPHWLARVGGDLSKIRVIGIDPGLTDMVTYTVLGDKKGSSETHRYSNCDTTQYIIL